MTSTPQCSIVFQQLMQSHDSCPFQLILVTANLFKVTLGSLFGENFIK